MIYLGGYVVSVGDCGSNSVGNYIVVEIGRMQFSGYAKIRYNDGIENWVQVSQLRVSGIGTEPSGDRSAPTTVMRSAASQSLQEARQDAGAIRDYSVACGLGQAARDKGHFAAAEVYFLRAGEIFPADSRWHAGLLSALRGLKRFDELDARFHQVMASEWNPAAVVCHAASLCDRKRYDAALAEYVTVLEQDSEHAHALKGLARVLVALGRHEEATACFEKAGDTTPDVWGRLQTLRQYYRAAGDIKSSLMVENLIRRIWPTRAA